MNGGRWANFRDSFLASPWETSWKIVQVLVFLVVSIVTLVKQVGPVWVAVSVLMLLASLIVLYRTLAWSDNRKNTNTKQRQEIEEFRQRIKKFEQEAETQLDAFLTMVKAAEGKSKPSNRRQTLKVNYYIGATPDEDFVEWIYKTRAEDSQVPIMWHHFVTKSEAGGRPAPTKEQLALKAWTNSKKHSVEIWGPKIEGDVVSAVVIFDPFVTAEEELEWRIEGHWVGLWDPLRTSGKDTTIWTVEEDQHPLTESLEINFILPQGVRASWDDVPKGRKPLDHQAGKQVLGWRQDHPEPDKYIFRFSADFGGVGS
jgi:hypothetical protein